MTRDLKIFLDNISKENLRSCSIETTLKSIIDEPLVLTHYTTMFNNMNDVEEYLALLSTKYKSVLLSITFNYEKNQRLSLDTLTGHLYQENTVNLISLEKLSAANLIGKGKLIEEIQMTFSVEYNTPHL
jgi:hypothetical protein